MKIELNRLWSAPDNAEYRASTTGTISIDGKQCCFSLEPTALMIPAASYPVKLMWSRRFERMTPHIMDVPGRSFIELHGGNLATDSEGCVLCAEFRTNEYEIRESRPATDAIEEALVAAEANHESNTIEIK